MVCAGTLLVEAKTALPHGDFQAMVESELPFGQRTAQRLMAMAGDERITNATHGSHLPPSWRINGIRSHGSEERRLGVRAANAVRRIPVNPIEL